MGVLEIHSEGLEIWGGATSTIGAGVTYQSLTASSGVVAPNDFYSMIGEIRVTGEGDTNDDLTTITAGATFTGKILFVRKAGAGTITVKQSASILMRTDCTLNHVNDLLVLIWSAANVWVEMTRYTYD